MKMQIDLIKLLLLKDCFSIIKWPGDHEIPTPAHGSFLSVTHTPDEISVVMKRQEVPSGIEKGKSWNAFKIIGELDFDLVGIINAISAPLAKNNIPVFVISTYNTDYVLIRESDVDKAFQILSQSNGILVSVDRN